MVSVPELVNTGNVLAAAAAGNVRLDVDPLVVALVAEHGQETGSNANGSWIRVSNGVQVCWFQSDTEVPTSGQTVAPWYHTAVTAFTFPAAFVDVPAVLPTSRTASNGLGVTVTGASTGSCSLRGWGVNNGQWVRFGYVAVGRWK